MEDVESSASKGDPNEGSDVAVLEPNPLLSLPVESKLNAPPPCELLQTSSTKLPQETSEVPDTSHVVPSGAELLNVPDVPSPVDATAASEMNQVELPKVDLMSVSAAVPPAPMIPDVLSLANADFVRPPDAPAAMLQLPTANTDHSSPNEPDPTPAPSPFRLILQDNAVSVQEQSVMPSSSFASSGRKSARAEQLTVETSTAVSPRQKSSPLHVEVPSSPRRSSKTSMASPHPPQSHDDVASDWMVCRTDAGDTYYYNIQRQESQWSTPRSLQPLDRPPPLQASIEFEPDCLHVAVSNGDFARVQELLAAGVAVDRLDDDGRTPLWYALEHLDIAVVLLNQSHSKEYIVAQDNFGTTLLHAVTRQRNIEMLTLLLLQVESADEGSSGRIDACDRVDVDARDSHQQTALHVAATFGFRKCVDMLLAHGASPAVLDENSHTPIMLATLGGHVGCVQLLQVALAALLKQTEVAVQAMPVQERTSGRDDKSAGGKREMQRANQQLLGEVERCRRSMSVHMREKEALETAYRIANSRLAMLEALAKRTAEDHLHATQLWQQKVGHLYSASN
ncbi:hypothetical protein H310_01115 [Aphanomyces invadans]|uniref:WW domain-containing protein n=1 Tax=Aphanomyces invadans TaxID=157072 RepID=A0A024UQI4_9STRA|nr:hypothetical protein H310_01115 [Aphanomyces invadans]ETW08559.1 hypothetical protein H310_01115 [Aphanomyces invadans]|eukprot:XP_008862364.1 hypothetical protein H310_01115 [Aphanomyces invadans]